MFTQTALRAFPFILAGFIVECCVLIGFYFPTDNNIANYAKFLQCIQGDNGPLRNK